MPTPTQNFFNHYAEAYDAMDAEKVAESYFIPSVVMSDSQKLVFTKAKDIANHIQGLMDKLAMLNVKYFEPEVCQTMRLSENIMFTNVKWTFKNDKEEKVITCFVSYTLQLEGDSLKIIVSVIDDEERELGKLL